MLFEDKQFIALTEIAKKIAFSITSEDLSIDHYLCALKVPSKELSIKDYLIGLPSWEALSDLSAKRLGFDSNKELIKGAAPKLKPADSLHRLLVTVKDGSFSEFLAALVSNGASNQQSMVKDTPVIPVDVNDAHFDAIYGYADVLAQAHNLSTIDLDAFVVGAWAASKAGALKDRPSIVNNLHANSEAIQYLMRCKGWKLPKDKPSNLSRSTKQGEDLLEALKSSGKQSNSLLAIVNQGVKLGMDMMALERTAFHEAGHAIVNLAVMPQFDLSEVVVDINDPNQGFTSYESPWVGRMEECSTREFIENRLCVALAGRVSEQRKAGHTSGMDAGAQQDLYDATQRAWNAIASWGMDDEVGAISLEALAKVSKSREGWLFDLAQQRLQVLMKKAYARTEELVAGHWSEIELVAKALIDKKRLTADEVLSLVPHLIK